MCILTVTDLLNLGLGQLNFSNSQLVKEAASVACHVCMTHKGIKLIIIISLHCMNNLCMHRVHVQLRLNKCTFAAHTGS